MTKFLIISVNLLLLLLGVQTSIKETTPTSQKGKASYYGTEFEGRKTANGEKFSNYDYT
jgi:rare lipoprotein A (peptidoglycan hydrolase)